MATDLKALLIDLGGVLYQDDDPVPGAVDTARWIREQRLPHLYLTNTTSRPRARLVDKLGAMGIDVPTGDILSPAVAAASWLEHRGIERVALFVPEGTRAELGGFEPVDERPQAVVIGDLGDQWGYQTLTRAFRLLMAEPRPSLVALGMSRYFRAADGLRLDVAPFVVALSHASGVEPVVLGKPAEAFFRAGLALLKTPAAQTLMIGDDLETDVGGAQSAGIAGMLVRTGKYQGRDSTPDVKPDAVLDSIAALPAWWRQRGGY